MAFIDEIKSIYSQGSMLMRLIFINIAVFVVLLLFAVGAVLFNGNPDVMTRWAQLPSDLGMLLRRPWTLITYMFTHLDFIHILFNMLWLYWLGRIFMEFFSPKQLAGLYLLGGLGGALLYLLAANTLPYFTSQPNVFYLRGASASVVAIVVATAVYAPDYKIGLLFLGDVSIKWIAIVTVLISLVSMDGGGSVGGNIAHIGGAIVGAWFALRIKRGADITRPLNACIDAIVGLFNGRSLKMPRFKKSEKSEAKQERVKPQDGVKRESGGVPEAELDEILKKIKAAGYDSLSEEERGKLFKASQRRTP